MRPIARAITVGALCVAVAQCGGQHSPAGPTPLFRGGAADPSPPSSEPAFVSAGPQVFVGAGDIGLCDDGAAAATARLLDAIAGTVFTLGDNAYPDGTESDFRNCYDPTWGRHKDRTRPVPGNHEYHSPGALPYFQYFGVNAGPAGLGYYNFTVGAWHAIALNSNFRSDPRAAGQMAWLRDTLAGRHVVCSIAYWHHPVFSSGPNGDSPHMREIWRLLYTWGVDVVLSAHDHFYERFAPVDADGLPDPARGIRQFIVGTGGARLTTRVRFQPNSELLLSTHGVLKLTLHSSGYDWEFVPVSGPGDSGSGRCH